MSTSNPNEGGSLKDDINRILDKHIKQRLTADDGDDFTCRGYIMPDGDMLIRAVATPEQWEQAKQVLIETTLEEALQLFEAMVAFGLSRAFYQRKNQPRKAVRLELVTAENKDESPQLS